VPEVSRGREPLVVGVRNVVEGGAEQPRADPVKLSTRLVVALSSIEVLGEIGNPDQSTSPMGCDYKQPD
jgi:hypothetical protein